jgi:hypothetical protein
LQLVRAVRGATDLAWGLSIRGRASISRNALWQQLTPFSFACIDQSGCASEMQIIALVTVFSDFFYANGYWLAILVHIALCLIEIIFIL